MCANSNGERVVSRKREFPIVIAYNDFLAGARGMRAYDLLAENLGSEFDFRVSLWKFDVLSNPALLQIAVSDAANAGMIMICLNDKADFSAPARRWLDAWVEAKQGPSALFALLDDSASPSAAELYLKKATARANVDFFLQRFQPMRGAGSLLKSQLPRSTAPCIGKRERLST